MSGVHLDVELRVLLEVVKEFLVVTELSVPLARLHEAKVVTKRNEKYRRAKESRLLPVLIQQEESSEETHRDITVVITFTAHRYTHLNNPSDHSDHRTPETGSWFLTCQNKAEIRLSIIQLVIWAIGLKSQSHGIKKKKSKNSTKQIKVIKKYKKCHRTPFKNL